MCFFSIFLLLACRVRAALMLWTGDHPTQCKVGCLKDGGYGACRRCHTAEEIDSTNRTIGQVVYGENRYQARHPPAKRNVHDLHKVVQELKEASTANARTILSNIGGVTGESSLWRLYKLYGFDISRDLVCDVMHILPLNIFKTYVETFITTMGSTGPSAKDEIEKALKDVTNARRKVGLGDRWPKEPTTRLGYFRAEEYQNFIMWVLPYMLDYFNMQDTQPILYETGLLLIDIAHLFYSFSRTNGWTLDTIHIARTLLQAWKIRKDDYYGPNASILEHMAGNELKRNLKYSQVILQYSFLFMWFIYININS